MTDKDLLELLRKLAKEDLFKGCDIKDHPCSLAIDKIQFLKYENKELKKELKSIKTQYNKALDLLIEDMRTLRDSGVKYGSTT